MALVRQNSCFESDPAVESVANEDLVGQASYTLIFWHYYYCDNKNNVNEFNAIVKWYSLEFVDECHDNNTDVSLSVCLSVCLFICLSVCLSVCMSVCVSVCVVQGNGGHTQLYLDRLFKSLESFYHPSNNGRWNVRSRS